MNGLIRRHRLVTASALKDSSSMVITGDTDHQTSELRANPLDKQKGNMTTWTTARGHRGVVVNDGKRERSGKRPRYFEDTLDE